MCDYMPIIFNYKICDLASECGGIEACPKKAIFFNEKTQRPEVDNKECINCGTCVKACPVGAIMMGKSEKEMKKIKEIIRKNPMTQEELFIERYGAKTVDPSIVVDKDSFEKEVISSDKTVLVEFWNNSSVQCLLFSIPYKTLKPEQCGIIFRKIDTDENKEIAERYGVNVLPSIIIFKNGRKIGVIEGIYKTSQEKELKEKINKIISYF